MKCGNELEPLEKLKLQLGLNRIKFLKLSLSFAMMFNIGPVKKICPCLSRELESIVSLYLFTPSQNGNGRFSRLVADCFLKSMKCSFPHWPIDLDKTGQLRKRYISSLKEADLGNYEPLITFMIEFGASDLVTV